MDSARLTCVATDFCFFGGVLNQVRLGGLQRLIQHVCVVMMMPNLLFVETAGSIADGLGGVGGEIALGWIELAASGSERLLRLNFNFRQVEAGDVREIAGNMPGKRQEFGDFGVHAPGNTRILEKFEFSVVQFSVFRSEGADPHGFSEN